MRVASTRPMEATAAAAALSAKDALRVARLGLKRFRDGVLPTPESLPFPMGRLLRDLDQASETRVRALRDMLAALPFAPKPLPVPCGFPALDARRAGESELMSRLAIGDTCHDALRAILVRLDLDLMIYEAALADVVVDALDASGGQVAAYRGAVLAAALARDEERIAGVDPDRRASWRRAVLAFAVATVVAGDPGAARNGETLTAVADLVAALGNEADAAFGDKASLEAFIARYAPHV